MIENMLLPTKFAPLSQLGVGAVTTWARANPDLASASADMLRNNPRTLIDRFFRLTTDQQLGLSEVSEDKLRAIVAPIAEQWAAGRFPNVQIEFEYETVPVTTPLLRSPTTVLPFNPLEPVMGYAAADTITDGGQTGILYNQTAPQQGQQTTRNKCKKAIVKIVQDIVEIFF